MGEGGRRKEEGGLTTAWPTFLGIGPLGDIWIKFSSTKHFLKCGGLVVAVACELFLNDLTNPIFRWFDFFRAPAGFCWTVR